MPQGLDLAPGDAVHVPLGPRTITGVVWDADRLAGRDVAATRLRPVTARLDVPPIAEPLRRLCEWVSDYYLAPLAGVIRMVWPSVAFLGDRETTEYRLGDTPPVRMTPKRTRAIEKLADRHGSVRDLTRIAGVSEAVIRGMVKAGALVGNSVAGIADPPVPDVDFAPPVDRKSVV